MIQDLTQHSVGIPSFQHVTECTLHGHCTLTSFAFVCCLFPVCPQTDTAQLYNTQSDLCTRKPHLDQIRRLVFNPCLQEIVVIFMTSHMVVDTSLDLLHGAEAQFGEPAGPSRPQVLKRLSAMESVYFWNCVGRCSQLHSDDDCFVVTINAVKRPSASGSLRRWWQRKVRSLTRPIYARNAPAIRLWQKETNH